MAKPDTIIVDGHAFSWQRLCELRRQQLAAWRLSLPEQPGLVRSQTRLPSAVRADGSRPLPRADAVFGFL